MFKIENRSDLKIRSCLNLPIPTVVTSYNLPKGHRNLFLIINIIEFYRITLLYKLKLVVKPNVYNTLIKKITLHHSK